MRRLLPAVVLLAGFLALAACAPEPAPTASPSGPGPEATTPRATAPQTPDPEPTDPEPTTPSATPSAEAGGLPADCAHAYSPETQDRLHVAFTQLNPAEASQVPSSKVVDLLDVIQGSDHLTCLWTPPGKTALIMDAALVPEVHDQFVRDALTQNFPGCDASTDVVDCARQGEQQQGALEAERVILRGDLMLTAYALNADPALVGDAIDDMLTFLP